MQKAQIVIILVILLSAGFLRLYQIDHGPLGRDEDGRYFRDSAIRSSVMNFLLVPTPEFWEKNPLYNYSEDAIHLNYGMHSPTTPLGWQLISVGRMIFGENKFGLRVMPAVFGVLYVLVFYFFMLRFYGKRKSLLATFLLIFFPFSIFNARSGAILEPFTIFFFIAGLFCLLAYKGRVGRVLWTMCAALMLFSNFPKAILFLGILFIWEMIVLLREKGFAVKDVAQVSGWYALSFLPSVIWSVVRAKVYDLPLWWFLEHPFARESIHPFRIIEIFYAYGSTKQAAFLFFPMIFGIGVFVWSQWGRWSVKKVTEKLDLLWVLVIGIIVVLMVLAKQGGPHNHSMIVIPMVVFATHAMHFAYDAVQKRNVYPALFLLAGSWLYVVTVQHMGALITAVPKEDAAALALYSQTFLSIVALKSFFIPLAILLVSLGSMFVLARTKYGAQVQAILRLALVGSVLAYAIGVLYFFFSWSLLF